MKRKIALLLALAMIVSLLPTMVFGNTRVAPGPANFADITVFRGTQFPTTVSERTTAAAIILVGATRVEDNLPVNWVPPIFTYNIFGTRINNVVNYLAFNDYILVDEDRTPNGSFLRLYLVPANSVRVEVVRYRHADDTLAAFNALSVTLPIYAVATDDAVVTTGVSNDGGWPAGLVVPPSPIPSVPVAGLAVNANGFTIVEVGVPRVVWRHADTLPENQRGANHPRFRAMNTVTPEANVRFNRAKDGAIWGHNLVDFPAGVTRNSDAVGRSLEIHRDDFPTFIPAGGAVFQAVISLSNVHEVFATQSTNATDALTAFETVPRPNPALIGIPGERTVPADAFFATLTHGANNNTEAVLTVVIGENVPVNQNLAVELPIAYQLRNERWTEEITMSLVSDISEMQNRGFFDSLGRVPVARYEARVAGAGFDVTSFGTPRFTERLDTASGNYDGRIRITENSRGVLSIGGTYWIRLSLVDRRLEWRSREPDVSFTGGLRISGELADYAIPGRARNNDAMLDVLYVPVTIGSPSTAVTFQLPGQIDIYGLRIDAHDSNRWGDVEVVVEVFRHQGGAITTFDTLETRAGVPGRNQIVYERIGYATTLTLANRAQRSIRLEEVEDVDDYLLVSGVRDWDVDFINSDILVAGHPVFDSYARFGLEDIDSHRTGRIRLVQEAPGTFDFNGRNTIEFDFGPGVNVLGVGIYARDSANSRRAFHSFVRGRAGDWTTSSRYGYYFDVLVREHSVSVRPLDEGRIADGTLHNIGFEFFLSVAPGYVATHGDVITVDISGRALGDYAWRNVPVATVVDPISVNVGLVVLDDVGEVAFGRVFNEPVSDVTIIEESRGALGEGQLIIAMEDLGQGFRGFGVELTAMRAYVANPHETSVQISPLRRRGGYVYVEIMRTGTERDEAPAIIRFVGVRVSGDVFRGHTYNLVVRGESVAANWRSIDDANFDQGFFPETYNEPLFRFIGEAEIGITDDPEDGFEGRPGQFVPQMNPLTLRPGMPRVLTQCGHIVYNAFFMATLAEHNIGAPGVSIAVVNPRVFAHIINVNVDWDPYRGVFGTVILQGHDRNGEWMRIELPVGSNFAYVDGVRVDIASFAPASGAPGTVSTILVGARSYVPVRFLAEVFGYEVDATDFPAVTIRP